MADTFHLLTPREYPEMLSLIIPLYNEEEMVELLRQRIGELVSLLPCHIEVIAVNDGSSDRTLELLVNWAKHESYVRVLGFARNFGHQAAVTAGLDVAEGEAVVIMDADLQDPPEVIVQMLREYRKGYDVVYGQRVGRDGESIFKRLTAWGFYRFMRSFIHEDLPADTGDFRLISRRVLETVRTMRETHRFLRGMVAWVGFPQTAVQFQRPKRAAGKTKYPLTKMIRFAWTAAVSFSAAPLRVSLALGLGVAFFGVFAGFWAVYTHWFGITTPGWTSLMAVFCVVGGAILFSIGVLGEYIGRIFEEIKGRPLYIVSTKQNISDQTDFVHGRSAIQSVAPAISGPVEHPLRRASDRESAGV